MTSRCPAPGVQPGPRRRAMLLAALGGAGAGALAGCTDSASDAAAGSAPAAASAPPSGERAGQGGAFRAARQPGIRGRVQPYAAFVALDLARGAGRTELRRLLAIWSDDIERLMSGRAPLTDPEPEVARHTAGLTVTVGVGPRPVSLARGAGAVPEWLGPLPAYSIDRLQERWCGGDLLLQVCADSPTTVYHAARRLSIGVRDLAEVRWTQRGFREPLNTGEGLVGMRNLFGQVDGSINPQDDSLVFAGAGAPDWLVDGSSLVLRRIRMDLDKWEQADRVARENAIGRRLSDGAPITGGAELDLPDFDAIDALGFHVVDDAAHVRRAHSSAPSEQILRRAYSYAEGQAPGADAGLLFAAYQVDPLAQFDPIQTRLAEADLLNLWTTPIGSAVFAILPGIGADEHLGRALLA